MQDALDADQVRVDRIEDQVSAVHRAANAGLQLGLKLVTERRIGEFLTGRPDFGDEADRASRAVAGDEVGDFLQILFGPWRKDDLHFV